MIDLREGQQIFIWSEPVDMRKSIDGLSVLLSSVSDGLPQAGNIYLFRNKSGNKVKLLYWDKNGFILHYKRLEKGCFRFQKTTSDEALLITRNQLSWLLAGLDFMLMESYKDLNFSNYF